MLREVTLKNALQSYIEGEDVRVILPMEDFEDRLVPIEKLFNDARFLVDKKAAKLNPEWEAAVQEMVSTNPPTEEKEDIGYGKGHSSSQCRMEHEEDRR